MRCLSFVMCMMLTVIIFSSYETGSSFIYAGKNEGTVVYKTFDEMSKEEKERVLDDLIRKNVVKRVIKIKDSSYNLNEELWYQRGVIVYGDIKNVNAAAPKVGKGNFINNRYRYLGYDINGNLYTNQFFPHDSDTGTDPWVKNWMTLDDMKNDAVAKRLLGVDKIHNRFSETDRRRTAEKFLVENPQWVRAGYDAERILKHFFFQSALSENGLTQGQFIGVHISKFNNQKYYQDFVVEDRVEFFVPPPAPLPPIVEDEVVPVPGSNPDPEPEPPEEIPDIEFEAKLGLPGQSFTNHPVIAVDNTLFQIDDKYYSGERLYEKGLARNKFTAANGNVTKIENRKAKIIFTEEGEHGVELTVKATNGASDYDNQQIEILKTPYIIAKLSGIQKQNRKQTLDIKIAKSPDAMLRKLKVKISNGTESVTVKHQFDNEENNQGETANIIKTRPIKKISGDEYFENYRLEFLTKNPGDQNFTYEIVTADNLGNEDTKNKTFLVRKDEAPEADILLEAAYLREPGENYSIINPIDDSKTDSDQLERSWFFSDENNTEWQKIEDMESFTDCSFGKKQKIEFKKTGLGDLKVKLNVKDIIKDEETLKEYISEDDIKSDTAEVKSKVINVAPIISLKGIKLKALNIVILSTEDKEKELREKYNNIKAELLERGFETKIKIKQIDKNSKEEHSDRLNHKFRAINKMSYEGNWTFFEDENYIIDNENLYHIDATWEETGLFGHPKPPYKICCYDLKNETLKWEYSFSNFNVPIKGTYLTTDYDGKYLFLSNTEKSMMIDKKNGQYLTTLDYDIGNRLYAGYNAIYSVKSDGIYKINEKSGKINKISNISAIDGHTKKLENNINFVTAKDGGLYVCSFDLDTEKATYKRIIDDTVKKGWECVNIDNKGQIVLKNLKNRTSEIADEYDDYELSLYVYGNDKLTPKIKKQRLYTRGKALITPILNEKGICNYITVTKDEGGGDNYASYITLFSTKSNYRKDSYVQSRNNYVTVANKCPFAMELNEKVYHIMGAEWINVYNRGYNAYPERSYVFCFDEKRDTVRHGNFEGELGISNRKSEYGKASDSHVAIKIGDNNQYADDKSEINVYTFDQTEEDKIFKALAPENADLLITYGLKENKTLKETFERKNINVINNEKLETDAANTDLIETIAKKIRFLILNPTEGKTGEISLPVKLKPNTTYSYEYITNKEPESLNFSVIHNLENSLTENKFEKDSRYIVKESYSENFNDKNHNPFFKVNKNLISDGYYKAVDIDSKADYNQYIYRPANKDEEEQNAICFTVPDGKKAILRYGFILDKDYEYSTCKWNAAYFRIDGERWDTESCNPMRGTYVHKEILESGEHKITSYAGDYDRRAKAKAWLTDIEVDIIEESKAPFHLNENEILEENCEKLSENSFLVTGKFKTPAKIPAFSLLKPEFGKRVISAVEDSQIFRFNEGAKPYDPRKTLFIDIPNNKKIKDVKLKTRSRANASGNSTYNARYELYDKGKVKAAYYNLSRIDHPPQYLMQFHSGNNIFLKEMKEGTFIRMTGHENSGTYATFLNTEVSVIDNSISEDYDDKLRFTENEHIYMEEKKYKDSLLKFDVKNKDVNLSGFKIKEYRENNGEEDIRVLFETFSDEDNILKWTIKNCKAIIMTGVSEQEIAEKLIYKKGEKIKYNVSYLDYEKDPIKKDYWIYTHQPFNDGEHELAHTITDDDDNIIKTTGIVLDKPIETFYIDGKYELTHWKTDNTARPLKAEGNPRFDKDSNKEKLTFYISGEYINEGKKPADENETPDAEPNTPANKGKIKIKSIKTVPETIEEREKYKLAIAVDDEEKKELKLKVEIYKKGDLVFRKNIDNIKPDAEGKYKDIIIPDLQSTKGEYNVIAILRTDDKERKHMTDIKEYSYNILSAENMSAFVSHAKEWDNNRKKFNLNFFKTEYNQKSDYNTYFKDNAPRKRGYNVFWKDEVIILRAEVEGEAKQITAQFISKDKTLSDVKLNYVTKKNNGNKIYEAKVSKLKTKDEQIIDVTFTAEFSSGKTKKQKETIIIDDKIKYFLMHKVA